MTAKIMLKSRHELVKRSTISTRNRRDTAGRQNILGYFKNNNFKNVLQSQHRVSYVEAAKETVHLLFLIHGITDELLTLAFHNSSYPEKKFNCEIRIKLRNMTCFLTWLVDKQRGELLN